MTGGLVVIRFVYGAVLLLAPTRALAALTRAPIDHRARLVGRVLGVRELLQAELIRRHPSPGWWLTGAGVDGVHAVSMLGLAGVDRRRRPLALHNAATATGFALASIVAVSRAPVSTRT